MPSMTDGQFYPQQLPVERLKRLASLIMGGQALESKLVALKDCHVIMGYAFRLMGGDPDEVGGTGGEPSYPSAIFKLATTEVAEMSDDKIVEFLNGLIAAQTPDNVPQVVGALPWAAILASVAMQIIRRYLGV